MITVKLSIEDYNRLYCMWGYSYFLCKRVEDEIVFVRMDGNSIIAHVKFNSLAGNILSHYTECLLKCYVKKNGNISVTKVCYGEYANCKNCSINYCRYDCKKGISKKLRKLRHRIEDIHFIDPIHNRNIDTINNLRDWVKIIPQMKEDLSPNQDDKIQEICTTADLLEKQLKKLLDKWEYRNIEN